MGVVINAAIGGAEQVTKKGNEIKDKLNEIGASAQKLGKGMNSASDSLNSFSKASKEYQKEVSRNTAHTSNLVSQFNDIGVMMAAGQNPLQLAFQQGTQISQVLTQMGSGMGALKALGGAFIGMLNPISLATLAVIGFGAHFGQKLIPAVKGWLGIGEDMKKQMENLKTVTDAYTDSAKAAATPIEDLAAKYGFLADEIARTNAGAVGFLKSQSIQELGKVMKGVANDSFGTLFGREFGSTFVNSDSDRRITGDGKNFQLPDGLNQQLAELQAKYKMTREEAVKLNNAINGVKTADNVKTQAAYMEKVLQIINETISKEGVEGKVLEDLRQTRAAMLPLLENSRKLLEAESNEAEKAFEKTKKNGEELVKSIEARKEAQGRMNAAIQAGDKDTAAKWAAIIDSHDNKIKRLTETIQAEGKKWGSAWDDFKFGGTSAFEMIDGLLNKVGLSLPGLMGGNNGTVKTGSTGIIDQKVYDQSFAQMAKDRAAGNDTMNRELIKGAAYVAKELGISIHDTLSLWNFESGWNPQVMGGDGGKYYGLNQFGPAEQAKYGIGPGSSIDDQARAVVRFNKDRGFDSSIHSKENYYATTLAGNPNAINAMDSNGTRATDVNSPKYAAANAKAQALIDTFPDLVEQSEKIADNVIRTEKAQNDWAQRIAETTANAKSEAEVVKATQAEIDNINRSSTLSEKEKRDAIIEVEVARARRIELIRLENDAKQQGINLDAVNIEMGKTYRQIIEEQANAVAEKTRQEAIAKVSLQDYRKELKATDMAGAQLAQTFGNIFSGIVTGTMTAKQALAQLISSIGNNLIKNIGTWASGGANAGAGVLSWMFGNIGAHADGGIVNTPYQVVGERGPELAQLPKGTRVHTAQQSSKMLGNSGAISIDLSVQSDGMVKTEILNQASKTANKNMDVKLKQYDKGSNNRVRSFQQNPRNA